MEDGLMTEFFDEINFGALNLFLLNKYLNFPVLNLN